MLHLTSFLLRVCQSADSLRRVVLLLALAALIPLARAASGAVKRHFDLAAGDAVTTLRQFVQQSGEQVIYLVPKVRGVKTNPVKGEFTAREVLERMVSNTGLVVLQDAKTGALLVNRTTRPEARPAPAPEPPSPEKTTAAPVRRSLGAAVSTWLAVLVMPAHAQPAGEARAASSLSEEVQQLSPFVVNTSKDVGYVAGATLSGSRTNTELKNLANPIDVFTKELMDDLAIRDIQDLTLFATGVEPNAAGDNNDGGQEREIWNHNYMQIRGFKTGTATRNFMELLSVFDAYNSERVEFSKGPNSILFGTGNPGGSSNYSTKLPLFHRNDRSVQWSADREGTHRHTGDFNQVLLRDKLAVRLNLLHQEREFYRAPAYHDEKAAHLVATYKPFKHTTVTAGYEFRDTRRALPRGVYPTDAVSGWLAAGMPRVTAIPAAGNNLSINGVAGAVAAASQGVRIYGNTWVFEGDGAVRNVNRTATTANFNVNGVGGTSLDVDRVGYPHHAVISGPNGIADTQWNITEADITHRIGERLHLSLAFARSESFKRQSNTVDNVLRVDPNDFGTNRRFGQFYSEFNPFRIDIENEITDVRATASYELDLRQTSRWLGAHQVGAMLERNRREEVWDHGRLVLTATPSGPIDFAAAYGATRLQNAAARVNVRDYLDFSRGVHSARDYRGLIYAPRITQAGYVAEMRRITPFASKKDLTEQDAALAVLHSRWWDDRVVTTVGVRKDQREFRTAVFEDDPATFERRPAQLLPGIPAGSHDPRNARLPETANEFDGVSRNYGAVFHLTHWLSLTGSYATNYSPGTESLNLFGQRVPHSTGESRDFGVRLNLLGGRIGVSLIKYETSEIGTIINAGNVNAPNGRIESIEEILLAHRVTSANPVAGGGFTTLDRVARGEELLLVGSPTPGWSVRLAATRNENRLTNLAPEVKAFFASRETLYEQHANLRALSGVGESIGEHLALARTSLGLLRTRENVQQFPASEFTARLTAKYNFDRSSVFQIKGFSAGGNYRWASAPVIGYYRNANATFDLARDYKGEAERMVDLFFIYERRLSDRLRWRLQLNIDNVFDETDPLPVAAVNDVDGANFRWVVTRLRPTDGRQFRIANTFSF